MISAIDTAIYEITVKKAESWEIGDTRYTALDLDHLRRLRNEYLQEKASTDATASNNAPFGITGLSAGSGK